MPIDRRRQGRLLALLGVSGWLVALVATVAVLLAPRGPEGTWTPGVRVGFWGLVAGVLLLLLGGAYLVWLGRRVARTDPGTFLSSADERRVMAAIRAFERRTSGEIRVHLSSEGGDDVLAHARSLFGSLGMAGTAARNGVLFVVAVSDRRLAVVGDEGIDRSVGAPFWADVVRVVEERFRRGAFAEGLEAGIRMAGEALATHFPHAPDDVNELPDDISRD